MDFELSSPALEEGARVPLKYTCEGEDISPPLRWAGAPEGAHSFVLLCTDPDAPGRTWWHWVVYDIPTDETGIPEAYPKKPKVGACRQTVNDFGYAGYGGPCPPKDHGTHHYHFRLLALDVEQLRLIDQPRCPDVEMAARDHVLASAELICTFSR